VGRGCVGSIGISASALIGQKDVYSMFALPPGGPKMYVPNLRLQTLVVGVSLSHLDGMQMAASIETCCDHGVRLFHKVKKSETRAVAGVLDKLMHVMCKSLPTEQQFTVLKGDSLNGLFANFGGFKLATPTSQPEPAIVWESFALITSEAKGFEASKFTALPQACQIAGDACLMLRAAGLPFADCVIPGLILLDDTLTIYAAYLLPDSFPCFHLLSRPLSLTSHWDRLETASWFAALRVLTLETMAMLGKLKLRQLIGVPLGPAKDTAPPMLDSSTLFFKPVTPRHDTEVVEDDLRPFRSAYSRVLDVFAELARVPTLCDFLVFPIGVVQAPGCEQSDIKKVIYNALTERHRSVAMELSAGTSIKYVPFLVYTMLSSQWKSTAEAVPCASACLQALIEKLHTFEGMLSVAGVVHMDLRPANIMWTCDCMKSDTVCTSMQVRVIDWDDACFVGEPVLPRLLLAYQADKRYALHYVTEPYASTVAASRIDSWHIAAICEYFKYENRSSFSDYMDDVGKKLDADFLAAELGRLSLTVASSS
jgi:hypothetical protein